MARKRTLDQAALISLFEDRAKQPLSSMSDMLRRHVECKASRNLANVLAQACQRHYADDQKPVEAPPTMLAPLA